MTIRVDSPVARRFLALLPDELRETLDALAGEGGNFPDIGQDGGLEEVESLVLQFFSLDGRDELRRSFARELIDVTGLCDIIPQEYAHFKPVVYDGLLFLLSEMDKARLARLLLDQCGMDSDADKGMRVVKLAEAVPLLYKLGQVIARNDKVEPGFRHWLVQLENGLPSASLESLVDKIENELGPRLPEYEIRVAREILSQASVAAVIGFTWLDPQEDEEAVQGKGVFKVIKPHVPGHLQEELDLLQQLALFYEENKNRYGLDNFAFIETLRDVSYALSLEIDLCNEQENMERARRFYRDDPGIKIPFLYPLSTGSVTSMELIEGGKITQVQLTAQERRQCCRSLARAFLCLPLFCEEELSFFHGDPHGGNIYVTRGKELHKGEVQVALLDWSLAGQLTRVERAAILKLNAALMAGSLEDAFGAIDALSEAGIAGVPFLAAAVREELEGEPTGLTDSFLDRMLNLLDRLVLKGVRFSRDLLLYRKAIFTVKGVLRDMDPDFSLDSYLLEYIDNLLIEEIPARWTGLFFPLSDSGHYYKTMLSNADLLKLGSSLVVQSLSL